MKILHLTLTDYEGGAARAVYRIHKSLISKNINSRILVLMKKTKDPNVFEAFDFNSKRKKLDKLHILKRIYKKVNKIVENKRWAKYPNRDEVTCFQYGNSEVNDAIKYFDANILHLHWINSFINLGENEIKNKPIVWTLHDCNPFTGLCHSIGSCENYKIICKCCPILKSNNEIDISSYNFNKKLKRYKNLNLNIVAPSYWLAEKARESKLLQNSNITVINHGLDTNDFTPIKKQSAKEALQLNINKKVILFGAVNASSDKNKGYQFLNKAIRILKDKINVDEIQMVVFGSSDGEIISGIKTKFLGNISDDRFLSIIYSSADVMVVPSIQEAFGQTASESLACGTPVVAFAATGLLDIINHKIDGYLAHPYEPEDLADGIIWCLENNDDGRLSKNARDKVLRKFTMEQMADNYSTLYKNILNK